MASISEVLYTLVACNALTEAQVRAAMHEIVKWN